MCSFVPLLLFWLLFQVGEITKIMKAYINMIVKKRCSVKSVSSYGSSWIRWLTVQDKQLHYTWTTTSKNGEKMWNDEKRINLAWPTQTNSIETFSFFHALSKPVTLPNYTGHLSLVTWNVLQVSFSGFYFHFLRTLRELVCACSNESFKEFKTHFWFNLISKNGSFLSSLHPKCKRTCCSITAE